MRRFWIIVLVLLFLTQSTYAEDTGEFITYIEKAKVVSVNNEEILEEFEGIVNRVQDVTLEILSGKYKGKTIEVSNYVSDNAAYEIYVKDGDKIIVMIEEYPDGNMDVNISDYLRETHVYYLLGLFFLLLIVIGKGKGFKSVLTLTITVLMVIKILLPSILKGIDPIVTSVFISIGVTIITILVIGGINSKSISAILGTSAGVLIAGLIAYIVGSKVRLTGLSGEDAMALMYIPQDIQIDFRSLLFSGIILGALGAIMDVGMSVASSIDEIHNANKNLTSRELFKAGMNVGKDIMGTMTNTLILAYAGSSLTLLLLLMAHEIPMRKIINFDIMATEIVRSLSGSIGLVLTVPITAFVSSILVKRSHAKESFNKDI